MKLNPACVSFHLLFYGQHLSLHNFPKALPNYAVQKENEPNGFLFIQNLNYAKKKRHFTKLSLAVNMVKTIK